MVRNKKITQQEEVNMYATKIEEAIKNLEEISQEDKENNEDGTVKTGDNIIIDATLFIISLVGLLITIKVNRKINK